MFRLWSPGTWIWMLRSLKSCPTHSDLRVGDRCQPLVICKPKKLQGQLLLAFSPENIFLSRRYKLLSLASFCHLCWELGRAGLGQVICSLRLSLDADEAQTALCLILLQLGHWVDINLLCPKRSRVFRTSNTSCWKQLALLELKRIYEGRVFTHYC